MRRVIVIFIVLTFLPQIPVNAEGDPFTMYFDSEVVIHPDETVSFRIGWHNIVGFERHIQIDLDDNHQNMSVEGLPIDAKRVGSGLQDNTIINLSVNANSSYETITFNFTVSCIEIPDWSENYSIDVLVSQWSALTFGANDSSSFYVQHNVKTTIAVNISNNAGINDLAKVRMQTASDWDFGFTDDLNGDNEVHLDLADGEDIFVNFWVQVPAVQDGMPLAGTGPTFILEAESSLDRRITNWSFDLEMQTWRNITIDSIGEDILIGPGKTGKVDVTIRNNGNLNSFFDATLRLDSTSSDRIESDNWTIALFNAFEDDPLSPNESRVIEIGFEAPSAVTGQIEVELIILPRGFQERSRVVSVGAVVDWQRGGEMVITENACNQVEVNSTCSVPLSITNTGNYRDTLFLEVSNSSGMNAEFDTNSWTLDPEQTVEDILLILTTIDGIEGLTDASITVDLKQGDGVVLDSGIIQTLTAPYIDWQWEMAESEIDSDGRLSVVVTMRNDGNTPDGLIIKMSTSYYTEMTFVPPENAIYESEPGNIRSFEIIDIEKGDNFTFRAWAKIPTDQSAEGILFLNITAHSRLAEETEFVYSTNSSFDAASTIADGEKSALSGIADLLIAIWSVFWAWKWIALAMAVSGVMINKSIRDRRKRLEVAALGAMVESPKEEDTDWLDEFHEKKQPSPELIESPSIPSPVFSGMFQAVGGGNSPVTEPVESQLVDAASTVVDHHEKVEIKGKMDDLALDLALGQVSKPHHANVALPDDVEVVVERTIPHEKTNESAPSMIDLDDLDLE